MMLTAVLVRLSLVFDYLRAIYEKEKVILLAVRVIEKRLTRIEK